MSYKHFKMNISTSTDIDGWENGKVDRHRPLGNKGLTVVIYRGYYYMCLYRGW